MGRCIAMKDIGTGKRQCPKVATHGEWCRMHAQSLGGWLLVPPGLIEAVAAERARIAAGIKSLCDTGQYDDFGNIGPEDVLRIVGLDPEEIRHLIYV